MLWAERAGRAGVRPGLVIGEGLFSFLPPAGYLTANWGNQT
jgi:hypothetical protein